MTSRLQTRAARQWVRASQSIRLNDPDGWMETNGPVWWYGSDQLPAAGWAGYGWPAGGALPVPATQLGLLPAVTRATSIIVGPVIRTTWRYLAGTSQDVSDIRGGTESMRRPLWVADPQLLGTIPGGDGSRPTIPQPRRLGAHAFWKTLLTHAVWWGVGAMIFVEDNLGQPLAGTLRIVNPTRWNYTDDDRFVLNPGDPDSAVCSAEVTIW